MRKSLVVLMALMACSTLCANEPAETFPRSLHATRAGKAIWYAASNGGFEALTGVPIDVLGCQGCHGPTNADGEPYPNEPFTASCVDCHATDANRTVAEPQCLGCHGRQKAEIHKLGMTDVHRQAGMQCWDCHPAEDLHGDGNWYGSIHQEGAISASCTGCHPAAGLPASHAANDPHGGSVHCASCHTTSVISCYNCHFDSQVEAHVKRAHRPIDGFVLLVNREKDDTVYPASFQSLSYGEKTFFAVAPYTAHSVMPEGRRCPDCHWQPDTDSGNDAVAQYNRRGLIRFTEWDAVDGALRWHRGVIPVPSDYASTLRLEFLTFDGPLDAPPGPDAGTWSSLGRDRPHATQMLFASPLTPKQMHRLGSQR